MRVLPLTVSAFMLVTLSGCASPPLRFYTLGAPAISHDDSTLPANAPVIAIARVNLPDYLDTQDMIVRDGSQLERSASGRWGSRLSQGITDLITAHLAKSWPSCLVTTQSQSITTPDVRLVINITRLDLDSQGQGTLEADWAFVPRDENHPVLKNRGIFSVRGAVSSDMENADLTRNLVQQLASRLAQTQPTP
ncbi:PqiC family protein [Gluconobacter morbifer]|uniref:ABC-type transport auxiliary lipoprotein component domain-containing protein n=1 Tax=Gluconobacter morbifer G707 TaxID=1088869 RepID=G6XHJ7_9PROT|nr:PqiC family protein [Gluconobacter morbifer]EHH69655.1 hypothetical protein GMO_09630 [Gluconobacter morbifer G707]